jgi:cell division protein FtsL
MAVVFDDRPADAPRRRPRPTTQPGPARRTPAARRAAPGASRPPRRREDEPLGEAILQRPLRSLRPRRTDKPEQPDPVARVAPTTTTTPVPRLRRAAPMRTRTHGGADRDRRGVVRTTVWPRSDRPMIRLTAGVDAGPPPPLVVVPRRRRAARLIAVGFALVATLMLVAAAFQTQLARRQVELDKVERAIRDANEQYNDLRAQRSELRAPERLATEARGLGMRPGDSTEFVAVDPQIVALVQQSAGGVFDANATLSDPLAEFSEVKKIAGSAP